MGNATRRRAVATVCAVILGVIAGAQVGAQERPAAPAPVLALADGRVTAHWDAVADAVSYEFVMWWQGGWRSYEHGTSTSTSVSLPADVRKVRAQVRTIGSDNVPSEWSAMSDWLKIPRAKPAVTPVPPSGVTIDLGDGGMPRVRWDRIDGMRDFTVRWQVNHEPSYFEPLPSGPPVSVGRRHKLRFDGDVLNCAARPHGRLYAQAEVTANWQSGAMTTVSESIAFPC